MMVKWGPNPREDFFLPVPLLRGKPGNRVETHEFGIGHQHRPAISGRGLDRTCAQILAFMSA